MFVDISPHMFKEISITKTIISFKLVNNDCIVTARAMAIPFSRIMVNQSG